MLVTMVGLVSGTFGADSSSCGNYINNKCYYNATVAANLGKYNTLVNDDFMQREYKPWHAPYYNSNVYVSELLLAGLIGHEYIDYYHNEYLADKYGYQQYQYYAWFYESNYEASDPYQSGFSASYWNSNELYKYAKSNKDTYKGMHFDFVTEDTPRDYLVVSSVHIGDIIFMDKTDDGTMDFSFIVTEIDTAATGYDKILVSYSNGENNEGVAPFVFNRSLGEINQYNNYQATFHVYRPTFYSDYGL